MLKEKIENLLNNQLANEAFASQIYLAMASWSEKNGYQGTAEFFYEHAEEEREHMLKFFHYINDRNGHAIVPALEQPENEFRSVKQMFEMVMEHEQKQSENINEIVGTCLEERDYTTHNFLQWFVNEQIEEESLVSSILDRLELLGDDKARMYMFDRDIKNMHNEEA